MCIQLVDRPSSRSFIQPQIQEVLDGAAEAFALQFAGELITGSQNVTNLLRNAPKIVTRPLSYTINNIRPFDVPVYVYSTCPQRLILSLSDCSASAVDFIGLIYLLILAVCLFSRPSPFVASNNAGL